MPSPLRPPCAACGASLVESTIVLAVAGVLAAIAVPHLGPAIARQRLESAASQLATDLQLLRSEAIARNESLRLSVYAAEGASCYLIHTGARADCRCDATSASCSGGAVALKTVRWPASDRVNLTANVGSIVYDPVQGTVSPAGSFRVAEASGRAINHVVNVVGRVRSCAPDGAVSGYKAC